MAYLLRVVLPDRPGSLGAVATAIGAVRGDILSLDVVERGPDGAVDDILVDLAGGLADTLITAAQSVDGVVVESLRPYQSTQDIHRDLELVDELAAAPADGLALLVQHVPNVFRAGWAVLLEPGPDGEVRTRGASPGVVVVGGRPGAPLFRASEVLRLAHLAGIAGTVTLAARH